MTDLSALRPRRLAQARAASAFWHRNYRLFFVGQALSLIGTWVQQVAQGWLVLTLTGDPFWLGVVAGAQFLPVMVLGLFAGVLADVLPKRQTLLAVQVVMMLLAIVLTVLTLTGVVEVWMIIVLALLLGDVQWRPGDRSGGRRSDDRGFRHGHRFRAQRPEFSGGHRLAFGDA